MTLVAHAIKAGDSINGLEVFDSIRKDWFGYYIPMIDGSQYRTDIDAIIEID